MPVACGTECLRVVCSYIIQSHTLNLFFNNSAILITGLLLHKIQIQFTKKLQKHTHTIVRAHMCRLTQITCAHIRRHARTHTHSLTHSHPYDTVLHIHTYSCTLDKQVVASETNVKLVGHYASIGSIFYLLQ